MSWVAIVPFNAAGKRKTRLSDALTREERGTLSLAMFRHVTDVLHSVPMISDIGVLCPQRPQGWRGRILSDSGKGLNPALAHAVRQVPSRRTIVIHADLPFVSRDDVLDLIAASDAGCALAPDRHETGTNALALQDALQFAFSFGPDSLRAHCEACGNRCSLVRRRGLAFDIDTPRDLELAKETGLFADVLAH